MIIRRIVFFAIITWFVPGCKPEVSKPNVLFLFADDQQYGTINALGNPDMKTPSIDEIVQEGTSFTNAFIMGGSSVAVCSPSRASLFSGLTIWNVENQGIWGYEISEKYKTLPQVFRENGYITFATGKNEPGREGHFARSFSCGDKILFRGMTGSQYRLPLCPFSPEGDYSTKKEVVHRGVHSAQVYADACIRFLDTLKGEKPFFAYVAFQTPHDPRQSPEEFTDMYPPEEMKLPPNYLPLHPFDNGKLIIRDEMLAGFPRKPDEVKRHLSDYYALISYTDYQIGRILESLKKSGMYENTIIVFSSDNGLAVGRHGLMGKQNVYDHSVHVPLVIAGPGIPKGELRNQLCYLYDIYPTLCEQAGLQVPKTVQFKSLNNVIKQKDASHRDYLYFAFMSWQRAVRNAKYKLIEYCVTGERHTQLFDVAKDPDEMNNLAADPAYASQLNNMRSLLESERLKQNDGNTPYPFTNAQGDLFWTTYFRSGTTNYPEFDFMSQK